ncbi:NAD(P)-binding domain-containing protein [Fontisubflavum oceani]|uniref:NAD(P)-binding domain-containing protein n=1 Tax=Fontisubflavum oceani TaxID=2978973 RepID=UPI0025B60D66|nr:NAD(P)-binding domain-containing protein [Fontisubflavum oceani]WJY20319.1 NAD(P)-binding domain-containing protein [Fontisubflavum oceani]
MTIVILGGTGVFGSRLARLPCRDGHRVVIAVRGVADAEGLAAEIGAEVLQVDRAGDLAPFSKQAPIG